MVFLLDCLTTSALLFMVTSGLMMIFGVMRIINFAHGAILGIGGYAAYVATARGFGPGYGWALALLAGLAAGAVVERLVVRPLYKRPLDAILATWGLGIVIIQIIVMGFGRGVQFIDAPIHGSTIVLGVSYSAYRLFMLPVAAGTSALLFLLLNKTRFGTKTRAVIMNEELAASLGINSELIRFLSFCLGAVLGTLAGALISPLFSVDPYMGIAWLTSSFMLVMVSGYSFISLMLTCLVFGAAQVVISSFVNPVLGGMTIAVLAATTLRLRSKGFSRG
ncbi:MAG: branched-chain amino acid ABC transporter permease [Deltaproteobacteria bacterium]|jgi:branched-chain amino acid transport system permease protein|nr:branched-chain amino acid ABC transporter permease [Deltaproteobacteria bacterium]